MKITPTRPFIFKTTVQVRVLITFLALSLISGMIIYGKYGKPSKASVYSYDDLNEIYIKLLNEFASKDFLIISKNVESRMITVFPEGLLLEKRKKLCFEDDPPKPSKFEIFFKDKEDTTLTNLT